MVVRKGDKISIHAPTRGATPLGVITICKSDNFNPRSHEGSDEEEQKFLYKGDISIHAPTRGATVDAMYTGANYDISIHAPTRGATHF